MPHVSYYVDAPGQWASGHTLPDLVLTHHSYVCCEVGSYNSQLLGTEQSCIGRSTRRASRATEVPGGPCVVFYVLPTAGPMYPACSTIQ